ncbi:MAG: nitrile hydratase accessory protein [Burkholderiales bacterium]
MKPPESTPLSAAPEALAARLGDSMPLLLAKGEGPVFAEPWQAHAFALVVQMHQRGLFDWPEWAAALAERIKAAQVAGDPDDGSHYWQHWLNALEHIVVAKSIGTPEEIHGLEHAWEAAARSTPHGQPIQLRSGDLLSK